jgi:hypothetical protein
MVSVDLRLFAIILRQVTQRERSFLTAYEVHNPRITKQSQIGKNALKRYFMLESRKITF